MICGYRLNKVNLGRRGCLGPLMMFSAASAVEHDSFPVKCWRLNWWWWQCRCENVNDTRCFLIADLLLFIFFYTWISNKVSEIGVVLVSNCHLQKSKMKCLLKFRGSIHGPSNCKNKGMPNDFPCSWLVNKLLVKTKEICYKMFHWLKSSVGSWRLTLKALRHYVFLTSVKHEVSKM
jgi:hypothetical protein